MKSREWRKKFLRHSSLPPFSSPFKFFTEREVIVPWHDNGESPTRNYLAMMNRILFVIIFFVARYCPSFPSRTLLILVFLTRLLERSRVSRSGHGSFSKKKIIFEKLHTTNFFENRWWVLRETGERCIVMRYRLSWFVTLIIIM